MTQFEIFVICHLIADYPLQNNWMALHKTYNTHFGFKFQSLAVHSTIYGIVFGIGFWNVGVGFVAMLFHGMFDFMPVTNMWLKLVGSRNIESALTIKGTPNEIAVYGGFTAVVYCCVDFVIHFATTYPAIRYYLGY